MRVQLPVESLSSFAGIRKVFAGAIGNLSATVLSSHLADCKFLAALAIDIMDRNLYERANDCRWWALDGTLRGQLSNEGSRVSSEAVEKLIGYINSLYTVYSNILVFDANGVVLAVSNPEYDHLAGQTLSDTWVAECLALRDSQAYAVSQFVPSALYAGQPTYIYLAPIFSADDRGVAGGIAIVFDSTPQFAAILDDALPRMAYGEAVSGSFALFVDEAGKIIAASTNAAASFPAGSSLPASLQVTIPATESNAQLMVLDEQVMAVGISPSQGYREFKGADDAYRNPVTALICTPLGQYEAQARLNDTENALSTRPGAVTHSAIREIATFHLGAHWLGLPVEAVVEAIDLVGATRLANAPKQVFGAMIHQNATLPIYNLHAALGLPIPDGGMHRQQVVVVRGEDGAQFGFLVDRLGEILEVPVADIDDLSNIYVGIASVLASVVKSSQRIGLPMLVVLSVASMSAQLRAADMSEAVDSDETQSLD